MSDTKNNRRCAGLSRNIFVFHERILPHASKALHCCLVLVLLLGDVEEIDNVCKLF